MAAIRTEARLGHPLYYSGVQAQVPSLLRAAERVFGSWAAAVEAAGFDYSEIRRYKVWTRERVLERIRMWHEKGADLSWRNVSLELDPSLAAATLHAHRFTSWAEALTAAGLEPTDVARYRRWTLLMILQELQRLVEEQVPLDQETLTRLAPDLRAAIYRVEGGLEALHLARTRQQASSESVASPEQEHPAPIRSRQSKSKRNVPA